MTGNTPVVGLSNLSCSSWLGIWGRLLMLAARCVGGKDRPGGGCVCSHGNTVVDKTNRTRLQAKDMQFT